MQWCQEKKSEPYFETSAKEALNVEQAFQTIAKNALARDNLRDSYHDIHDLPNQTRTESSSCNC